MAMVSDLKYLEDTISRIFKDFGFEVTYCERLCHKDELAIFTGVEIPLWKIRNNHSEIGPYLKEFYEKFKNSHYSKDLEATYKMEADMLREELEELKQQNNKLLEALSDGMEVLDD